MKIAEIKRHVRIIRNGIGPTYGAKVLDEVLRILDDYERLRGGRMTDREQITHCEAYRAARMLFDYCNGRTCRICIFAEKVGDGLSCQFANIIPYEMGGDITTELMSAKENIDVLRNKNRGV